jgi:hypothetical protein
MMRSLIAILDTLSPIMLSPVYRLFTALAVLFGVYLLWIKPPFNVGPPRLEDPWYGVRDLIKLHTFAWLAALYYDLRKKGL